MRVRILIEVPKKYLFLSNPKDWYGINALARCMELRRSRAWHRAKRVLILVLLRIDAIHHFVVIPYGTSRQFHTATCCGFHPRLRREKEPSCHLQIYPPIDNIPGGVYNIFGGAIWIIIAVTRKPSEAHKRKN